VPDERLTIRQWLVQQRQTPRLCRMLWEPLALAALNQSIDAAGAQPFHAVLTRMFGPEPDASTLLMSAVPLDELWAGPARTFLETRGSIVTTNAPGRVAFADGRAEGVWVRSDFIPASVVISAVPWFAFADLTAGDIPPALSGVAMSAAALGSAPIVTVNLWLAGAALQDVMVGLPGRTFQWVFDKRRLVGLSQSHVSMVASGADTVYAASNETLIETAIGELRAAFPHLHGAPLRHAMVIRERRATFSVRPGGPARPATETPVAGLFLAGDWIATGLPATIESAVISGHRAARAVLRALG
jgi:hypothetical protein